MINPELPLGDRALDALGRYDAIDPIVEPVARAARAIRDADPRWKSLLSGTWLGHSLHPLLTDLPIGAYVALAVLDSADLAGAPVSAAADIVLGFGLTTTLAASTTGWSDWSDTIGAPRRVGLWHAAVNGTAALAYLGSLALRRRGRRRRAIALAYAAFGALSLGAYLGGELSSGMQLGVKHTAEPKPPPDDFVDVAGEPEVEEGKPVRADANGIAVVLVRHAGTIYALADACTHRGGPLHEGKVEGGCISCPWHGSRFALQTGRPVEGPATFPQPRFEVRVSGGRVAVRHTA